jgi:chemotaxis protein MotC
LPPNSRRGFLLTLAKSAVVNARFDDAAAAATEALEGVGADSPEAMRARLYLAAARMFSDAYDAAAADLRTIAAAKLDRDDADLLAAARRVASELRVAADGGFLESSAASLDGVDKGKASGPALAIERARNALDRTAGLVRPQDGGAP